VIVILSCIGCAPKGNPEAERAAIQCANAWLALVDTAKYDESWDQTAEFFRNAVAKEKWENATKAFRAPLGKLVSRELKSRRYTTSAPGALDGQYVIIQYKTTFEKKASAIETVTPMLDKDGKWRVSAYSVE
jgi:hypothetical protein